VQCAAVVELDRKDMRRKYKQANFYKLIQRSTNLQETLHKFTVHYAASSAKLNYAVCSALRKTLFSDPVKGKVYAALTMQAM